MRADPDLFRLVAEANPDVVWVLDDELRTVHANRRTAELLGRDPAELPGLSLEDCHVAAELGELRRHVELLQDAPDDHDRAVTSELQLLRADGSTVWVRSSTSPLVDDAGHRIGWVHRISNDTEQRELLASLRRREHLLAEAQSIASIGSWEWDVVRNEVTWSDQLYQIYGVDPRNLQATFEGVMPLLHPDDRQIVEDAVASVMTGGHEEFAWEGRIVRPDGTVRWVRGLGRAEHDETGRPIRLGGTNQDITERVLAERRIAEANERLSLLQTLATAANQSGTLEEALAMAAAALAEFTDWRLLGSSRVDPDAALARAEPTEPTGEDAAAPAGDLAPAPWPELVESCRRSQRVETAPAPGRKSTHSILALPVLVDGETVCVVEMVAGSAPTSDRDRTLAEQVAAQLTQVAQRESDAVHLSRARDAAMETSRLKSEFLATMTHEIRSPMNGVVGLTELLLRSDLDPQQRRLGEGLERAARTLLGIVDDILDLSKIEAGRLELERADLEIRAVLDTTVEMLRGPAAEKGLELRVSCDPDVPTFLQGDAVRLGQVVTNLASNAVKYTDEGRVEVRAEVASSTEERVLVRVSVTDTGRGLHPEVVPQLFDPFTQAEPSTTHDAGGTGLGLAISRELVSALGGTIEVESAPGEGSTFTFTADLGRSSRDEEPDGAEEVKVLRGLRVLVVDGEEPSRGELVEQLRTWGADPVAAPTSEAAMEAVRRSVDAGDPFAVALIDHTLPDGDGIALARAILAGSAGTAPRMVLLATGTRLELAAARAAGFADSLARPLRESALRDSLLGALGAEADHPARPEHPTPLTGARILVVEDNPVNQMVAVGLLESGGYRADVAADGEEAVAALRPGHPYAAALMDCRLPGLDGFDATRAVRAAEPEGERVPIIAMTASALEGEQEHALQAGMDDFLTKPVDALRLHQVVRRWTREVRDQRGATPAPVAAPVGPPVPLAAGTEVGTVAPERMRMLDELSTEEGSLLDRAAANFVDSAAEQREAVHSAVEHRDPAGLAVAAHRLRGGAANLGLPEVAEAARALENLGDAGAVGAVGGARLGDAVDALDAALDRALETLASLRERGLPDSDSTPPPAGSGPTGGE